MLRTCGHGVSLDRECLACTMMWRIEQRKDAQIEGLRAELRLAREELERLREELERLRGYT